MKKPGSESILISPPYRRTTSPGRARPGPVSRSVCPVAKEGLKVTSMNSGDTPLPLSLMRISVHVPNCRVKRVSHAPTLLSSVERCFSTVAWQAPGKDAAHIPGDVGPKFLAIPTRRSGSLIRRQAMRAVHAHRPRPTPWPPRPGPTPASIDRAWPGGRDSGGGRLRAPCMRLPCEPSQVEEPGTPAGLRVEAGVVGSVRVDERGFC